MKISIITLFPEMFAGVFDSSIIKRAQTEGLININLINLRDFGIGKHKTVDDTPYGGGVGMVLKIDVLDRAISATKQGGKGENVILLDPKGKTYSQQHAEKFAKLNHLILVSGRYEGFDERVRKFIDYEISIGDYVLSGGEIPAMVIVESISRLIPGVLKKNAAVDHESFSPSLHRGMEYPQYTRPKTYRGLTVPEILLSGDQKAIEEYRKNETIRISKKFKTKYKVIKL